MNFLSPANIGDQATLNLYTNAARTEGLTGTAIIEGVSFEANAQTGVITGTLTFMGTGAIAPI